MSRKKTVAFYTLGCKLNYAETSTIARQLLGDGFEKAAKEGSADIWVINSCSVTANADVECRRAVRRVQKQSPDAYIVVIGCYAQLKPNEIAAIEGVDLILGTSEKFRLNEFLKTADKSHKPIIHAPKIEELNSFSEAYSFGDRTRAFLKVQDGCDYGCTYCTIPLARGKSRSNTIGKVLIDVNELAAKGIREIVLTGVNIGDFGKNINDPGKDRETFFDLIKALDEANNISRFRISSIEPNLITDEAIELVKSSKRFMPHFHIPLQSGCDKILKAMHRRYTIGFYQKLIEKINASIPDCGIGVDVIAGFPGETEEDFLETYGFINELNISYLHVFPYSERKNTEAANITDIVPPNIKQRRSNQLRILSAKKRRDFYRKQLGKTKSVLFESENKSKYIYGFTGNYIKVRSDFRPEIENQISEVVLEKVDDQEEVMIGKCV